MRRRKKISQEETGLDLTPMLDIVFIMLIFFIVTTSFVKESGIEVNRPSAQTAERNEKGNILVAISENNEIYIDGCCKNLYGSPPKEIFIRGYSIILNNKSKSYPFQVMCSIFTREAPNSTFLISIENSFICF